MFFLNLVNSRVKTRGRSRQTHPNLLEKKKIDTLYSGPEKRPHTVDCSASSREGDQKNRVPLNTELAFVPYNPREPFSIHPKKQNQSLPIRERKPNKYTPTLFVPSLYIKIMNGGRTHDFQESSKREIVDGILARCRNLQDLQDESSQTDNTGQTGSGEDGLAGSAGRDGGRSSGNTGTGASRTGGSSVATGRRSLGGGADGAVGEGRGSTATVAAVATVAASRSSSAGRSSSTAMGYVLVAGFA